MIINLNYAMKTANVIFFLLNVLELYLTTMKCEMRKFHSILQRIELQYITSHVGLQLWNSKASSVVLHVSVNLSKRKRCLARCGCQAFMIVILVAFLYWLEEFK